MHSVGKVMMAKIDIGEIVASSMHEIIKSPEHMRIFKHAQEKCCACSSKCEADCPCKKDVKCPSTCNNCSTLKSAGQKCCSCSKCDGKCPCKGKCADCSECMPANDSNHVHDDNCACGGDVMGMTAFNEMVDLLTKISSVQEELGLTKSSGVTLIALSTMIKELQKKAQFGDQNDAKVKDFMGGGIHTLTGPYTGKKDDPYVMTSEVDELDTKEEVEEAKKMMEAPRTYSALLKDPQLAALERRVQEMGEAPSQLEVSPEAITDLAPSPYIGGEGEDLGFSLPAPSRLAQRPLPGGASAPNTEEDLQVANLLEARGKGRV